MKIKILFILIMPTLCFMGCGGKNVNTPNNTVNTGYYVSFNFNNTTVADTVTALAIYNVVNIGNGSVYNLTVVGLDSVQSSQNSISLAIQGMQPITAATYNLVTPSSNPSQTMLVGCVYAKKTMVDTTGYTNVPNSLGFIQITTLDTTNKVVEGTFSVSNLYGMSSSAPLQALTCNISNGKFRCKLIKE